MSEEIKIVEQISDIMPDISSDDMMSFEEFISKLTEEYNSRLEENDWYVSYKVMFKWWDAELRLYGERFETDKEKETRLKKENQIRMKELAELKRLKEKYGDI